MREPAWMTNAYAAVGLSEIDGALNEPKVVQLFAESGNAWVKDDATAWCGAFVGAMFARAGRTDVRPPGEKANALRAREWLKVGTAVTSTPRAGDICIFSRVNSPTQGHVAFYVEDAGDKIKVLGGNQSNKVSVASYAKSRLLGIRRVAEAAKAEPAVGQPSPPIRRPEPPRAIPGPPDVPKMEPGEKPLKPWWRVLLEAIASFFKGRGR